jgi:hypothetical protein
MALRDEHILRVFDNRVLKEMFRLKKDEVRGGWRKLQIEEPCNLSCSSSIIRTVKSRRLR